MKDLVGLLNQLSYNTLIFQLKDPYQEVLIQTCLLNQNVQEKEYSTPKIKIKIFFDGVFLDILILQKNTKEEFKKLTKKLLKNLIMMELSFL